MEDNYKVDFAFLDSGTGGIPYMLALKKKCPDYSCVYLGDTAEFPYGEKSVDEIVRCASNAVSLIIKKWNPRALVIACNTMSVTALETLRKNFLTLPIVGTVPAIKLAAKVSRNKRIGFLATNASVSNPYSKKLIQDFASDCDVVSRGDPDLISFIEREFFTSTQEQKIAAVKPSVDFFKENGCDTVVLGCTHFTHIADLYAKVCGDGITVVDSRDGVSNQAIRCIGEKGNGKIDLEKDMAFYVTAATESQQIEYKILCSNLNIPWGGVTEKI